METKKLPTESCVFGLVLVAMKDVDDSWSLLWEGDE